MNGGTRAEIKKHSTISVGNWIWTIILSLIPAVNVITFIVLIIASKNSSKRNFAISALIVTFLLVLLYLTGILFFYDPIMGLFTNVKNATILN